MEMDCDVTTYWVCFFGYGKIKAVEILQIVVQKGRGELSDLYTGGRKILENRKES